MTDNNFHLPRMMHKQSQQQQAQQDHQQILNAITERSRGIVQQQQQQETNDQDNHHNEQPNPQIVLHYQTMHEDQTIQDDQIIEEDHYVDDIEESNVEMIDEDGMAVTLTTVGTDNGGPATTIIHKPAFKKQQQNNFHLHPLPPPPSTQRANDIANLRQPKSINSANVVNATAYNNNNNNTITKNSTSSNNHQYQSFIGRLVSKDNILLISQNVIEIGRNSSKSMVDFHVGKNSFVSRKHLILQYDGQDFNLVCASKNGVFIDGVFQRKSVEATPLPSSCTLRFPSTNIRIQFENLADQKHDPMPNKSTSVENTNVVYQPLKISIPEQEGGAKNIKSPFPSPTGTMSAANSCPTSPRQNYHDFYATHNNGSDYMDFPAPSTSGVSHEDDLLKPPFSYAQLIVQSITAAHDKQLTLSGIYSYISKNYPYYRTGANKGWQNSIRHNLSLNRYFIKVPRSQDEPGKGSFWRIDPMSENKLIDQSYRKRRQRGGQGFRTPFGMPRSAPVSPSLMDNSQDNSPQDLRDVVLQSAPGSPRSHNYSTDGHRSTSFNSQYASFVSPQNTSQQPQNVLKRERDTELYEDTYYSDSDEYEPAKRPKV